MSARAAHDHLKAAAAQSLGDNRVRACAVQHHGVGNGILPARRGKNVPHAAQVTFTLFPHIADKHERQRVPQPHRAQQRRNRQHCRDPRPIVGNSRPIQPASLLSNIQWRVRRKYGVNVCAQRHVALSKSGMHAEHVAHIVDANIVQPDFAKALGQPCSPC